MSTSTTNTSFLSQTLQSLAKRPVKNAFDANESTSELFLIPAASRPFALILGVTDDSTPQETFAITLKALKGNTAPTAIDKLSSFDSIDSLKKKTAKAYSVDVSTVRLVFKGKALTGTGKTLADFNITQGSIVHLMITAASASAAADDHRKDPFTEVAKDVGSNSLFWAAIEKSVAVQFPQKEHANKVMNAFIVGFAGLLTDKDAAEKVKTHARK
ncbi:UNVERIFIED_CONTAM: hypothetical protein HDU68_006717 [Siphonaria sp. JEL0065]|nr:hypothetical protein HDU68_006717 [Siphonaria sp. JEL0065]